MAHRQDYVPRQDAAFDIWLKNLVQYVQQNTGGGQPRWSHIPQAAVNGLTGAYTEWHAAYECTLRPCTSPERETKNGLRILAEKTARNFVNAYLRYFPEVTEADKVAMGLHVPGGGRSPITPPKDGPVYHITQLSPRILGIVYQHGQGRRGSKPPGCRGARIYYGVFDEPPKDQEQLPASTWATRCPHAVTFRETDRGRRAWFALKWEIDRENGESPWSEIQSEIIP